MDRDIPIIDDAHAKAIEKVLEQVSKLDKGESKEVECPKCKKKLYIAKNNLNGHFFAKCETKNCIFLIQ